MATYMYYIRLIGFRTTINTLVTACFSFNLLRVKSRCAEDPRPRHYLREEYIKGLSKSALKYKLQIQIHACNGKTNRRMLNASEEWDSTCHAWEELADVVITGLLPTSVIRKTEFTVANRPASMGVLRSLSVHDFSSVVDAHVNELDDLLGVASVKTSNSTRKKQVKYKICTLTGDVTGAGTDADVSLTLIGNLRDDTIYILVYVIPELIQWYKGKCLKCDSIRR